MKQCSRKGPVLGISDKLQKAIVFPSMPLITGFGGETEGRVDNRLILLCHHEHVDA